MPHGSIGKPPTDPRYTGAGCLPPKKAENQILRFLAVIYETRSQPLPSRTRDECKCKQNKNRTPGFGETESPSAICQFIGPESAHHQVPVFLFFSCIFWRPLADPFLYFPKVSSDEISHTPIRPRWLIRLTKYIMRRNACQRRSCCGPATADRLLSRKRCGFRTPASEFPHHQAGGVEAGLDRNGRLCGDGVGQGNACAIWQSYSNRAPFGLEPLGSSRRMVLPW